MHRWPYLALEPDASEVYGDVARGETPEASVWISAHTAAPVPVSLQGHLHFRNAGEVHTDARPAAWSVTAKAPRVLTVAVQGDIDVPPTDVALASAATAVPGAKPQAGWSLALSDASGTERWCVGGPDGALHTGVWDADASDPFTHARALDGHVADVTRVRFFPSGTVLLTTSLDMRAKIYSALDGTNPRTFVGHTRAVLASAIRGIGREVLTGSADGTVRLWDVGRGSTTSTLAAPDHASVGALGLVDDSLVGGLQTGALVAWDVRTGAATQTIVPASPLGRSAAVSALAVDEQRLVAGTEAGVGAVYDRRQLAAPLATFWRNSASIEAVALYGNEALVSTADGLPYRLTLDPLGVTTAYAGWDAESVDAIAQDAAGHTITIGHGRCKIYH